MENDHDKSHLELNKLSFDNLKKTDQDKQCRFEDFQPFLEYSPLHLFESSIEKFIQGCKKSLHFLTHSIRQFHVLTLEIGTENQMFQTLYKSISVAGLILRAKKRAFRIKTGSESLYELLAHKRKYSKFPED
jgi:hypothetical protein